MMPPSSKIKASNSSFGLNMVFGSDNSGTAKPKNNTGGNHKNNRLNDIMTINFRSDAAARASKSCLVVSCFFVYFIFASSQKFN